MKIAIIGMGHMGSWLARELSKENTVAVFDNEQQRLRRLDSVILLDGLAALEGFNPDLLVNVVSLQNTIPVFEEAMHYITRGCIIGDMASVKGSLSEFYGRSGFRFVSVHPMFGPTFADMDALRGESAIIIKESHPDGAALVRPLFERLGISIFEYSFAEHDKMMAYSLTLPFISSMTFASCVDKSAVPGTTFAKHMKIAKGLLSEDDHLLGEVLFNAYSLPELDKVTAMLEYLKHIIRDRDQEVLTAFLGKLRGNIL